MKRLLLVSSSRTHGTGFLEHCGEAIRLRLSGISRVLFVPYALADRDGYAALAASAFEDFGFALDAIHHAHDPVEAVEHAEAIFVGGGNSFRLLKTLYDHGLVDPIRARALGGMPYIGSSAGTNMACPTIRTSNDMPIVEPPTFAALNLIPFQINPHFLDADPDSKHQGETRQQRLQEYLEENDTPVVGLREGSWLTIDGEQCVLGGCTPAICFRRGAAAVEISSGSTLDISGAALRWPADTRPG